MGNLLIRKKYLEIFIVSLIIVISFGCTKNSSASDESKLTVAVSVVPEATFVKAVAGDLVNVVIMIPPGYSPANYLPTPRQIAALSDSRIYFTIGVPTEEANILPKLKDLNGNIKVVALADEVGKVHPHRYFDESALKDPELKNETVGGRDPHIWLSPKRVKIMVETICEQLSSVDQDNKAIYKENTESFLSELERVDKEIKDTLKNLKGRSFIIYHPSLGYFADDYGIEMVAIEENGKKATAKKIQEVIDFAQKENIKFVFYQEEFDSKQAKTIAEAIKGTAIKIAPLSPDYLHNLEYIAKKFKEVLE